MFTHTEGIEYPTLTRQTRKGARWYKTPAGELYPSVTTLLSKQEKPALESWKKAMGPKKAQRETKRCADRGTAVHEIIEKFLNNDPDHKEGYDDANVRLFNKVKTRLKKIDNIHCQEQYLYSDMLRLAGCVDCIGEYDGKLSVIDFKTSNGPKHESMIGDYFLQCTAYAIMYSELFNTYIEDIVIIIAPEQRTALSMVYKRKIDEFVPKLLERIAEFEGCK